MLVLGIGILITGGFNTNNGGERLNSVEIYNPTTRTSCSLPQFPETRSHTQNGDLACGGDGGSQSCDKWNSATGTWIRTNELRERRIEHVSWSTSSGIYLIGGWYSGNTSEKILEDGSIQKGFDLRYDTT